MLHLIFWQENKNRDAVSLSLVSLELFGKKNKILSVGAIATNNLGQTFEGILAKIAVPNMRRNGEVRGALSLVFS